MKSRLSDKARLQHILEAVAEIEFYTKGIALNEFLSDSKTHFATIKQLEIIGEASVNIDPVLLKKFSEIEWRAIRGFRNILVHEYFSVKLERVWATVFEDLPLLKETVEKMIKLISP